MNVQRLLVEFPYRVKLKRGVTRKIEDVIEDVIQDNDPVNMWLSEGGYQLLSYPLTKAQEESGEKMEFDHNTLYYRVATTINKDYIPISRRTRKWVTRILRSALTFTAFFLGIAFFGIGEDGDPLMGIIAGAFFAFWFHFGRSMEKRR